MDNLSAINTKISKPFIAVGIIGLLISIADILDMIFPLHFSNPDWIFNTTQNVIGSLIAPALCIVLLLAGIYFTKNYASQKNILIFEKLISIVAFGFGILICINLLFYSLSIKSYEVSLVTSLKTQSEDVLKQVNQVYQVQKAQIPEKLYEQKVSEIKQKTSAQIKQTKRALLRKNIKIVLEMILYILLYFLIGIFSFSSAKNGLVKLRFSN
jgi:uncharacterized membrane protein